MNKKAFTLTEILIVIGIIGILATIVLVVLSSTRDKARDTKRKADLYTIGRFLQFGCFMPSAGDGEYDLLEIIDDFKTRYPKYASSIPKTLKDPKLGTDENSYYYYIVADNGSKCVLYTNFENENEKVTLPDISEATPGGGTGVFEGENAGWNDSNKYYQISN